MTFDIGKRIKNRRLELGLTQKELSEKAHTAQSTLHSIESGQTKNPRNMGLLAHALECTPEYLQYGIEFTESSNISPVSSVTSTRKLPLLSWVQAGNWSEMQELTYSEIEHFPCPVHASAKAFALKIQGESMSPKFSPGDHIFVDPEAQAENGSFVVARLDDDNQATFKQLIIDGGMKYLKAINPDWPNKFVEINGNCTIIGKVIYKGEQF